MVGIIEWTQLEDNVPPSEKVVIIFVQHRIEYTPVGSRQM
jgi:hypothetical protein